MPAEPSDHRPLLPTVTPEEVAAWRREFAERFRTGLSPSDVPRVEAWATSGLRTSFLPKRLQGPWNQHMKKRVTERLRQWFSDQAMATPADLVARAVPRRVPPDADRLRTLLLRCIGAMTADELEEVRLPASALLRVGGLPRQRSK
jgi:hypothetical protein